MTPLSSGFIPGRQGSSPHSLPESTQTGEVFPDTLSITGPSSSALSKVRVRTVPWSPQAFYTVCCQASHAGPSLLRASSTSQENVSPGGTESRAKILVDQFFWAWRNPSRQTSQTETLGRLHSPSPSGKSKASLKIRVRYGELHPCPRFIRVTRGPGATTVGASFSQPHSLFKQPGGGTILHRRVGPL